MFSDCNHNQTYVQKPWCLPVVMENLPLFVLPMVLLPGEVQDLRVFEPRYKQMLDDCLLDGKNFGLIQNDQYQLVNHWDGPMQYGCEAEIIHHETKGTNHFLQIVGRRRFTVEKVHQPALPPFDHPSMSEFFEEEGIYPDLETLLNKIPDDVGHSKLYISADVNFVDQLEPATGSQQDELREIVKIVLRRIGFVLRVEDDLLTEWIETSPVMQLVDDDPDSIFLVAALMIGELDVRQSLLESSNVEKALEVINSELYKFEEE